jgi:3-hydroxyisobutyrate dehydrogenase-like beta-hydroxyacid dehydrogenase
MRKAPSSWTPLCLEVKNLNQGVIAAQSGELTFMVGGDKAVFEKAKGVLGGMGKKLVHCGDIGMGQAAKICNNMLLGISMAGVAECMNLGIRLGLDGKLLMDIVNSSTGRCWSSEIYNPVPGLMPNVPSARNYEVRKAANE